MNEEFFRERYPEGFPATINPDEYQSLVEIFDSFVQRYAGNPAFTCLGQTLTYAELNAKSAAFAAYLQNETSLQPGDRIAVQLPNILQDRKSTRLNSSHVRISYAVFCLKKKKKKKKK